MSPPIPPKPPQPEPLASTAIRPTESAEQQMRGRTRRGFIRGGVATAAGFLGWKWLRSQPDADGIPWPLRQFHRLNEWVWSSTYSNSRLAPEFPAAAAGEPKENGRLGVPDNTAPGAWRLIVSQPGAADRTFSLRDLAGLPRVEMTTELKCVEGWSQVATWSGVRLADFLAAHGLGRRSGNDWYPYVFLATPDGEYYVGLDTPSALHPQTLLCDQLNGEPLSEIHGGPLRVVLTVKYGFKSLKWLGRIRFQEERSPDYWGEQGYDWYAGL
jgi:DMSO/TMAO reductase YedYZ molybdopterin-dependent catalytic subunit